MSEPIWLPVELVVAIHESQLRRFGGPPGIRDFGALESALGRPRNRWAYEEGDLATLAAAYAFGIARNHPFVDGNKRTAAVACEAFIMLNGAVLDADDLDLYPRYVALAEGSLSEAEFATWLRERIRLGGNQRVNEERASYAR